MKKISKKLALARETVRVLSGSELEGVAGGTNGATPTTTITRRSQVTTVTAPCRQRTTIFTAMCVAPPPTY